MRKSTNKARKPVKRAKIRQKQASKQASKPADPLYAMRHSCEHVLHQAFLRLYRNFKEAIGPAINEGFYIDFDPDLSGENKSPLKISEADFPRIEAEMAKIIKENLPIKRKVITSTQAKKLFKNNPYKIELIKEHGKKGEKISTYSTGKEFIALCAGPHIESTGKIGAFKLLSIAGAYWHGSEKNKMLTRIYGTCFPTQKELDDWLKQQEQAKKRDHRRLGKELELFTINDEVGQGLTIWLPKGSIIRREIEDFMVKEQIKMGYQHVYSPHIGVKSLWVKSGHWDLYREKMYSPMDVEGIEYLIKPMTCPMHIQSYTFKPRSYRDLPFRIAEIASVYRYEQSGELNGLLRVRAFTQDDAHVFCTPDQAVDEFLSVFNFIRRLYKIFGFCHYRVRLGVKSSKEKYLGSNKLWQEAEKKAISALKSSGSDFFISKGDAAFYGPKADFLIKDALGREWQCGTVQIDFMLPERFGLVYTDKDGKEKTPVMIHRAPLGSLERWLAILIENYEGAFPVWLAPVQAQIIPVADRHLEYANKVAKALKDADIRVELKDEQETVSKKIRNGELQKVPYLLIVGDREIQGNTVAVRQRGKGDLGAIPVNVFISKAKKEIEEKTI